MRPYKGFRFSVWVTLAVCLLQACGYWRETPIDIGDGGLLSGKPCLAPCFWEIRPGVTTKDQAIEILRGKGAISYHQTNNLVFYGDAISFDYDSNGIVYSVGFVPSTAIDVETLIVKYGVPDAVEVAYTGLTPEHPYFNAGLFFNSIHTYAMLERQEIFPAYSLSQDTRIAEVVYFDDSSYENRKTSSKHITKWTGYGAYQDPDASN